MSDDIELTLARLKLDFVEHSIDRLIGLDQLVDSIVKGTGERGEQITKLQREIHTIKGTAGSYGLNFITLISHRLEDYLESSKRLDDEQWLDVQKYLGHMLAVFEASDDPTEIEQQAILDALPTSAAREFTGQQGNEVTVLVVMPKGVQRSIVGSELASCGFNLSFASDPLQAIELAISLKPDVILSNQEFSNISGTELAAVFAAIKSTSGSEFALMTSHDELGAADANLPGGIHVIHKGKDFLENLTECLIELGLFGNLSGEDQKQAASAGC
ncbi:MAG: Hpt domain-containing protein [Rhodospirillales bacterium]|nr:Hpt domain-containing protein [Rhodospirillales bacterium]